MPIHDAVIPVAGLGTRLLPLTRSQPKEMLPVLDRPVVQYVVEELIAAGIDRVLFVTGRRRRAIEDHFDADPELHSAPLIDPRTGLRIMYTRQADRTGSATQSPAPTASPAPSARSWSRSATRSSAPHRPPRASSRD